MSNERLYEADVLVIGGGIAGCFAAIRAREQGADVILVDKGYAGKAGATPMAALGYLVCSEEWGSDLRTCLDEVTRKGQYVNDRDWTEAILRESLSTYEELVKWGASFPSEHPEGKPYFKGYAPFTIAPVGTPTTAMPARRQAEKLGVRFVDKTMITDLVRADGRVAGALGFSLLEGDVSLFVAKATIVCAGFTSAVKGDGDAMAYRAGADLTTKEYAYTWPGAGNLAGGRRGVAAQNVFMRYRESSGAKIDVSHAYELDLTMEFLVHEGRAPIYWDLDQATPADVERMRKRQENAYPWEPLPFDPAQGGRIEMSGGDGWMNSCSQTGGIWPVDMTCASTLPGLFSAGECCGTRYVGSYHPAPGFGLTGSAVTGGRAGVGAAEFARKNALARPDGAEVSRLKALLTAPAERTGGFGPRWAAQMLQNTITPYYMKYIKHGERLQAGLTIVGFLRDHVVPKLFARDRHEFFLAHEVRNMVLSAEMVLRASLFRTESRGNHYREDFPRRDDTDWLAWVKLRERDGRMELWKEPIPEKWRIRAISQ
ncbi:MAG: FAD-binding protein [Deltaproteobacteria bacterium]|nr:FAD-binding protein [Deltaproteobacteria bacterium]